MDNDNIDFYLLIVDSKEKKFKNFPFKIGLNQAVDQELKICDTSGTCKLTLKVGEIYHISVLKPDGHYQQELVVKATNEVNQTRQKITLTHSIDAYLTTVILIVKDMSIPPKPVAKAHIQIGYMGKNTVQVADQMGRVELKALIGEPLRFQLLDPMTKKPMHRTHVDEIITKKINNEITVIQPSIRADSSLDVNKPSSTTSQLPQKDLAIRIEQMQKMWPKVAASKMQPILDELNSDLMGYKLNTSLRKAHFIAQVRQEVGFLFSLREQVEYLRPEVLKKIGYYRTHPKQAEIDGYNGKNPANGETIANRIYDDNYRNKGFKLGNVVPGDGWKYLGRGLKQLTGRDNYRDLTIMYGTLWSDEKKDFVAEPELLEQAKYAVRSAIRFWLKYKLYEIADKGATEHQVDAITAIINKGTDSYGDRRKHFIQAKKIF
ncbi:glycoside hydrolase family 19 protein [Acinetobacter rudis]|uniref:Glycoside hydrolase family 19 n=1 Tax=Acinetobacter rudis TaxID=632955 RepID=A0AAW8J7Q0_9GAMM|nr:glycoside hydrolase family 19 [Acinetobacter rudis]MDQ8934731.1 glycoside hydrolase family 19 [Acinetobacter rudis]MDQ9017188.1 glycoside hydrolase family 19 [Acinetobacter rudis]